MQHLIKQGKALCLSHRSGGAFSFHQTPVQMLVLQKPVKVRPSLV